MAPERLLARGDVAESGAPAERGEQLGLLVGPIQAAFLVINGILLVALAQRKPSPPPPPAASSGTGRRRHSRPRIRAAAAAVAMAVLASVLALLS